MVVRCAWRTCNADERYPERLEGGRFVKFPTPKSDLDRCKRWIKACGRPHEQLNVDRINKHKAVCSKHFVGSDGPTIDFPDPIPADGSRCTPARKRPRARFHKDVTCGGPKRLCLDEENKENVPSTEVSSTAEASRTCDTQTDNAWIDSMDMLVLAAENKRLQHELEQKVVEVKVLKHEISEKEKLIAKLTKEKNLKATFGLELVLQKEKTLKSVFKFYAGITYIRFLTLLQFLLPNGEKMNYCTGRKDIQKVSDRNGLFLTLCRLRHAFALKDLAVRFGLSAQSAGIVFDAWIKFIHSKMSHVCMWPHRDIIIESMPVDYKKDFPTSLVIIDGTELKTQIPCALGLQSQLYSDYKSSTTLKGLIGCDPRGCLTFVSDLFTGSISDKAITECSGFYEHLKILKANGYIKEGDSIMADKGFNIEKELNELGLQLNIPPFASRHRQMTSAETILTAKIAKHRVHIERLIRKVKTFKIVSYTVPTSLFRTINSIWSVCCFLTLYQDVFVKDKPEDNLD